MTLSIRRILPLSNAAIGRWENDCCIGEFRRNGKGMLIWLPKYGQEPDTTNGQGIDPARLNGFVNDGVGVYLAGASSSSSAPAPAAAKAACIALIGSSSLIPVSAIRA